jgi:hypothetical protein
MYCARILGSVVIGDPSIWREAQSGIASSADYESLGTGSEARLAGGRGCLFWRPAIRQQEKEKERYGGDFRLASAWSLIVRVELGMHGPPLAKTHLELRPDYSNA